MVGNLRLEKEVGKIKGQKKRQKENLETKKRRGKRFGGSKRNPEQKH